MCYDEVEIDAKILEIIEDGGFNTLDDEEFMEIIDEVVLLTDDDYDEAFEYISQFEQIDRKRFLSLCLV
jgi:hypothetical protein